MSELQSASHNPAQFRGFPASGVTFHAKTKIDGSLGKTFARDWSSGREWRLDDGHWVEVPSRPIIDYLMKPSGDGPDRIEPPQGTPQVPA